ncbi:MAG: DUF507 family protein [Nitrospirae bacterium]|nr:DUF507 family protein [Nitrospirota bacterium]
MRVPKSWVPIISREIMNNLMKEGMIEPKVSLEIIIKEVEAIVVDELMAEDRLMDEVREKLKSFESEIEKKHMDYKTLFDLMKQKLIKERNIII